MHLQLDHQHKLFFCFLLPLNFLFILWFQIQLSLVGYHLRFMKLTFMIFTLKIFIRSFIIFSKNLEEIFSLLRNLYWKYLFDESIQLELFPNRPHYRKFLIIQRYVVTQNVSTFSSKFCRKISPIYDQDFHILQWRTLQRERMKRTHVKMAHFYALSLFYENHTLFWYFFSQFYQLKQTKAFIDKTDYSLLVEESSFLEKYFGHDMDWNVDLRISGF